MLHEGKISITRVFHHFLNAKHLHVDAAIPQVSPANLGALGISLHDLHMSNTTQYLDLDTTSTSTGHIA